MIKELLCKLNLHKFQYCYEKWKWDGYTSGGKHVDICKWCKKERVPKWIQAFRK